MRNSTILSSDAALFRAASLQKLAPGGVSFPQFFFSRSRPEEVLTMSAIARRWGTPPRRQAALWRDSENLGYVVRSVARDDRRKVMVCIAEGSALATTFRGRWSASDEDSGTSHFLMSKKHGCRFTKNL
jgi:hypothetical protein